MFLFEERRECVITVRLLAARAAVRGAGPELHVHSEEPKSR